MLRDGLHTSITHVLTLADRRTCSCIIYFVAAQCIVMFCISLTIFYCLWKPELIPYDFYKLASVMYLYDQLACSGVKHSSFEIKNLQLNNDTRGHNVIPIRCIKAKVTVTTRLSSKSRKYMKISVVVHVIWLLKGVFLYFLINYKPTVSKLVKWSLELFFYLYVFVICFDVSMAVVYMSHISQSLTKNMIIRYSGWGVLLTVGNVDDFGGWLPMLASACWLRGLIIFGLNIYCCRRLQLLKNEVVSIEYRKHYVKAWNQPIPEPERYREDDVLYYKRGYMKTRALKKGNKKPE